jgi:DNA-binding transcriptional regulator YiaG
MNFLEMKEAIKSEIDEENTNEYINGYLKSRSLRKENLIQQLLRKSNLSKRKKAILIGVNRETVRKVSKEPFP